jgi:hypothetical protein
MLKSLFSAGICLFGITPAFATTTTAAVGGICQNVLVAGQRTTCSSTGVIYMQLPNGRVLFTVGLADRSVMSFVGEKDSQPNPEQYWLYLSRVRISSRSTDIVAKVAGTCVVKMTTDGTLWHSINCKAEGEGTSVYQLDFIGNQKKVAVSQVK